MATEAQPKPVNLFLVIFFTVLLTIGLVGLGGFGFWFYQSKIMVKPSPSPVASVEPSASSDLVNTNPVNPSPKASPMASVVASPVGKSDLELIKKAFSDKYSKPVESVNVNLSSNDGTYANGGVSFAGEMGGGWFLAYNDGSQWIIVADGNGTVMCSDIDPYNFPVDMVPECWDETTNSLYVRE